MEYSNCIVTSQTDIIHSGINQLKELGIEGSTKNINIFTQAISQLFLILFNHNFRVQFLGTHKTSLSNQVKKASYRLLEYR